MPAEIRELEEHEMPEPMLLTKEERPKTRTLYQTVFSEDSQKFVDFYYEYKTRDNQIYALWENEQYVSMVHLNPYTMHRSDYPGSCIHNKNPQTSDCLPRKPSDTMSLFSVVLLLSTT